MKIYKKINKRKIKSLEILLFLLIIPVILGIPLLKIHESLENEEDEKNLTPKLASPPNSHYFTYFKIITIDHNKVAGLGTYVNFPVLISITDTDLRSKVQSDGDDIAFSYGDVWLDHEIELFDQTYNSTHAKLVAWVRIPSLSGSVDTVIRMYYSNSTVGSQQNPTGVWDSNFVAVWHMSQDPSSSDILDSTSNNYDLNTLGFTSDQRIYNGKVGIAIHVDGINDRFGVSGLNAPLGDLAFQSWFSPDTTIESGTPAMTFFRGNSPTNNFPYMTFTSAGTVDVHLEVTSDSNEGSYGNNDKWGANKWYQFTYSRSTSLSRAVHYINGSVDVTDTSSDNANQHLAWNRISILANSDGSAIWGAGAISEFRILKVPLSAGWVNTEYQNQYYTDSFYTIGTENLAVWEPPNYHYFTYYKFIIIDHNQVAGTGSHSNFPFLISLIDKDLKYHAQSDGDDIAFATDGLWLDHEIELFNQSYSSTQAKLLAWIKIPFLSATKNTTIVMYYGNSTMESRQNPSGVWQNNYRGVWHLNELIGGTDAIKDSTTYSNDGTDVDNPSLGEQGQICNSIGFNDISYQRIEIPDDNSLDISNQLTVEAWINPDVNNKWMTIVSKMAGSWGSGSTSYFDIYIAINDLGNYDIGLTNPSDQLNEWSSSVPISTDVWQQFVFTYDGSTSIGTIYTNGNFRQSHNFGIGNLGTNANPFYIGFNRGWINEVFDGFIDEVHISSTVRSNNWILTEFDNQNDPESFYTVGKENLVNEYPLNYEYFNFYKEITLDHTKIIGTGSHVNFPLLISILDEDLHDDVQSDGDDIAFSMDGKWLDHQIERFNQNYNSTHAQLIVWVRIPFLSTAFETNISMYFGNSTINSRERPSGVWNSNYMGVWHLNQDPSDTPPPIKDSTDPPTDGTSYGTMTTSDQVSGMIDGAIEFDGINDYISFLNNPELQITGELTVQIWFKANRIQNDYLFNKMGSSSSTYGWDISFDNSGPSSGWVTFRYHDGVSLHEVGYEPIKNGTWYHVVGVFKPNEYAKFFVNGTLVDILTSGIAPSLQDPLIDVVLGRRSQGVTPYYDGIIDEARISNLALSDEWIATEFNNQYDPTSFYTVGPKESWEGIIYIDATINAVDLYDNLIPNATVSMYQYNELIDQGITSVDGSVSFTNVLEGEYNFTVTISSNLVNGTKLVNSTVQAIILDQSFQTIDLICNVSTHFFEVIDVDNNPVESGWIIVGNVTHPLQKCIVDPTGHTKFWWSEAPPSTYNYTIYYRNNIYNPPIIELASGYITTVNATIQVQVELTTLDFTVKTFEYPFTPVSGAKLKFTVDNPLGRSIVNLTTNINGKVTLRWLNSSGISGNYSLQIELFGSNRLFNRSIGGLANFNNISFTVSKKDALEFRISFDLSKFQTELISLNPTDYIEIEWGTILKLRTLFNVSKVDSGYESFLGPVYADSMTYNVLLGGISIKSGQFLKEAGTKGRHYIEIDIEELESTQSYIIVISAYKSGYTIPDERILQLDILDKELELIQSDNDDSDVSAYWLESVNMTLNSYGSNSETLTIENLLFQSIDHEFNFLISDVETQWNLSKIVFNIYNIAWNTDINNINITIEDPYGSLYYMFNSSNHSGWDYSQGTWTGIALNLNKASRTNNNNFEFIISGTYDNSVDIIADAYFTRDSTDVQYSKFNVSRDISLLTEVEGWVISNITFEIFDCYNTSTWSPVDLSSLTKLNITTNEGFIYSLDYGNLGTGTLTIDDRIIYPIGNQFLFTVESSPEVIFNVIIKVEYSQGFYKNNFLETLNLTKTQSGVNNGGLFQIGVVENSWNEQEAVLWVKTIKSGSSYFFPSEVAMSITIGGQKYNISDYSLGTGRFSLTGFSKEQILNAIIESSLPVNFTVLLSVQYERSVSYEILGSLSYAIVEEPTIYGPAQYNSDLGYYLKTIDTTLLDADEYTVRFTISKEHYSSSVKDFNLIVLSRPTLLNQSSEFFRKIESVYVKDAVNFTFVYADALKGTKIANLKTQYYIWERYDKFGNVAENGYGDIISTTDNTYILDFNTESRIVGEYLLIVTLEKDNYDYKNAMMLLNIKEREIGEPILSDNFQNRKASVVKGKTVQIQLFLTDPTKGDSWLNNATVTLKITGNVYSFTFVGNGTYEFNFPTYNINAFFTSVTLTGTINITKEDYISQEFNIIIVVEMEQIFPGIPTFYFLLVLSITLALVGSIAGYGIYRYIKIPAFVRKLREMKKAIKKEKKIAESLLYSNKEVFIGELLKNDWAKIGLSIEETLGVIVEKEKKKPLTKRRASQKKEVHDKKPLGLLLMKWDERIGTEVLAKYPKDVAVSDKTLMQIYSAHEYSGEKGVIMLTVEASNILSYYTGPEQGYYLLLILSLDDDPDYYEGGIADILQALVENIEDDDYIQMIPSLFQRLSLYPSLSSEEILCLAYHNKVTNTIINLLREDGVISKSELTLWLKDKFLEGFFDMEAILTELVKLEILKVSSVKNMPSELIFLINDVFTMRVPPLNLLDKPTSHGLPSQFAKEYPKNVKDFFQEYHPTEEDFVEIAEILVNPQVYETLRLLRTAIVTRQDLEKLKQKGVDDVFNVLKLLYDNNMIKVYHDEKNIEYYALISDFYIEYIFPKYLLTVIKTAYEQKSKPKPALIEYLNILEETYFKLREVEKSK